MWTPGIWELMIVLVIVVLVFGTGKLSGVGGSLGTAIKDFKSSIKDNPTEEKEESDTNDEEHTA